MYVKIKLKTQKDFKRLANLVKICVKSNYLNGLACIYEDDQGCSNPSGYYIIKDNCKDTTDSIISFESKR